MRLVISSALRTLGLTPDVWTAEGGGLPGQNVSLSVPSTKNAVAAPLMQPLLS